MERPAETAVLTDRFAKREKTVLLKDKRIL